MNNFLFLIHNAQRVLKYIKYILKGNLLLRSAYLISDNVIMVYIFVLLIFLINYIFLLFIF